MRNISNFNNKKSNIFKRIKKAVRNREYTLDDVTDDAADDTDTSQSEDFISDSDTVKPTMKMYAPVSSNEKREKNSISNRKRKNSVFKKAELLPKIRKDSCAHRKAKRLLLSILSEPWTLAHRTDSENEPDFKELESHTTLKKHILPSKLAYNTFKIDEALLRTDGNVFFTIQPKANTRTFADFFKPNQQLYETARPFERIPYVSASKDLLYLLTSKPEKNLPCFNGTSEEVKEQIIITYINKIVSLHNLDYLKETDIEQLKEECLNMIHEDKLEVRIPTHVAVNEWKPITVPAQEEQKPIQASDEREPVTVPAQNKQMNTQPISSSLSSTASAFLKSQEASVSINVDHTSHVESLHPRSSDNDENIADSPFKSDNEYDKSEPITVPEINFLDDNIQPLNTSQLESLWNIDYDDDENG